MPSLKQMIKNKCEDDRSLATKLSKKVGFSNPTTLYKFLNEEQKETEFDKLLGVVQELFPEREFNLMSEYILTLNPNKRCAREALEYANINKLNDLFVKLLDKLSACSNAESKEWANVYRIDYEVASGRIKPMQGIELLNSLIVKSDEIKVFKEISKFYNYHDLQLVDMMVEMSTFVESALTNLNDGYVSNMYNGRFTVQISNVYLHTGRNEELRQKITSSIDKIKNNHLLAVLHMVNGNSYIFNDYDNALKSFNTALEYAEQGSNEHWQNEIKRSHNFLNNYWGKQPLYLNEKSDSISDIHEMAFYYARVNKDKCLEILNDMDLNKLNSVQKGFHYFYRGLATNNKDYFYDSIEHFNDVGEKFYKQISINELRKLGESDRVLRIFAQ